MRRLAFAALCLAASFGAAAQYAMPPAIATPSYQGLWWNSPAGSQSGWGMNIAHQGEILFATWFTYDTDGSGMWLVVPDAERLPGMDAGDPYYGYGGMPMTSMPTYSGTLYRTTGPAFDAVPFDAARVGAQAMGAATFQFSNANNGSFSYTVNGVQRTLPITRQVFAAMPDCSMGGTPSATPNFSDLWWRSPAGSESGWGVNVTHQGDTLFATWFTYDASGRGLWLVMPNGARAGGLTWSGPLYRTRGPAFDGPWDNSKVSSSQVGTATFAFADANNGNFTYTVDGVSQSKPITRQVFAAPTTVCR